MEALDWSRGSEEAERESAGESADWLASHPSTVCRRCHTPEQLSFVGALWRPDDAKACPLSILYDTTSKKLIMELIRANPHWNVKLDRGPALERRLHPLRWEGMEVQCRYRGRKRVSLNWRFVSAAHNWLIDDACRIWTLQFFSDHTATLFASFLCTNKHNTMNGFDCAAFPLELSSFSL